VIYPDRTHIVDVGTMFEIVATYQTLYTSVTSRGNSTPDDPCDIMQL